MGEQKISTSKKKPAPIATIALIVAGFLAGWPTLAQAYPYQDANLPVEDRVNDLLPRMDINEKVGQMTQ
jgi:beta-glucosidase